MSFQSARTGVSAMTYALSMPPMHERIYISCRVRNYTERVEKLIELYTKMPVKGNAV